MGLSVVLDVDTGTDDAAALWLAATSSDIELVAVTATWGNTTAAQAARNTRAVLAAAGRPDVPVFVGANRPLGPAPKLTDARQLMGTDGLGDVGFAERLLGSVALPSEEDAVTAMTRLVRDRPGELTLLAVAPLSTVAAAIRANPDLPALLAGVVVMGGAVAFPGNLTPAAEANIGHDPVAAAEVMAALAGPVPEGPVRPPRLVPLDVTLAAPLTPHELAAIAASPLPGAKDLHEVWAHIWPAGRLETGKEGCWPAHDLLAVWCALHADVCEWARVPLAVDTGRSAAWGATVADRRVLRLERWASPQELAYVEETHGIPSRRWDVALHVDADAYRAGIQAWLAG